MDRMNSSGQLFEDTRSHPTRSRASSGVSTTQGLLSNISLASQSPALSLKNGTSRSRTSSPYISPQIAARQLQSFLPTPVSQAHSPFPQLPEDLLSAAWFELGATASAQGAPLVRVDPRRDYPPSTGSQTSSIPTSQAASMSTVALQNFDPFFNMGSRSTFGWSDMESGHNSGLLGHDLGHYGSEASMTPPSGHSSVTASPPRSMGTDSRELRRQQDRARRDSKAAARMRRTGSSSTYAHSPPSTLTELASSRSLPVYTTGPTQISLLTEPTTTLPPTAPYSIPTYPTTLPSDPQGQSIFSASYQTQPSYIPDYQSAYSTTSAPSLPSQYGRPPMGTMDQQPPPPAPHNMMYTTPMSIMGPTGHPSPPHHMGPTAHPSPPHHALQHHQRDASGQTVRVLGSRPKPQCWDHGCNGRQFSTFSNLLRHQREKSGQATKSVCPNCGAEFTRTTARNGHQQNDKCKGRRNT